MFENLNKVRNAWDDGKVILIHDEIFSPGNLYMVIPSQQVNTSSLLQLKKEAMGDVFVVMGEKLAQALDIPPLSILYISASARYKIISLLAENPSKSLFEESISLSVDHRDVSTGSFNDMVKTIAGLGDFQDNYDTNPEDRRSTQIEFSSTFKVPGHIPIRIPKYNLLRTRIGIEELVIALADIANQANSITVSQVLHPENGQISFEGAKNYAKDMNLELMDSKTIINLWRSIKKVPKKKIAFP